MSILVDEHTTFIIQAPLDRTMNGAASGADGNAPAFKLGWR
jgi:hypothetical protein